MKISTKDNNEWINADTGKPCEESDPKKIPNPNYGTITHVTLPDPPTFPLLISATSFQDIFEDALGGGATGRTAFGNLVRTMQTSADDEVRAVYERYAKTITFDKPKVTSFLALMVSKSLITGAQRTSILGNWPEG